MWEEARAPRENPRRHEEVWLWAKPAPMWSVKLETKTRRSCRSSTNSAFSPTESVNRDYYGYTFSFRGIEYFRLFSVCKKEHFLSGSMRAPCPSGLEHCQINPTGNCPSHQKCLPPAWVPSRKMSSFLKKIFCSYERFAVSTDCSVCSASPSLSHLRSISFIWLPCPSTCSVLCLIFIALVS